MEQTVIDKKDFDETKNEVKNLIKSLKGNENPEELEKIKREFKEVIKDANPLVIAMAENELAKEGFTMEDLMSACEIHLMLFKDSIENPDLKVPDWHPIHQFQLEHKEILKLLENMRDEIKKAKIKISLADASEELSRIEKSARKLMEAENHNVRQENTLFPILEKHGIEQPPAIMWAEHTEMKEQKKDILKLLEKKNDFSNQEFFSILNTMTVHLLEKFSLHTQKEEHILYVTALQVITDDEWKEIKEECDNLGYFELSSLVKG